MPTLAVEKSVLPIFKIKLKDKGPKIEKVDTLGTGFVYNSKKNIFLLTAKHVFENNPLNDQEHYSVFFRGDGGITFFYTQDEYIIKSDKYDVSSFMLTRHTDEAIPLSFCKTVPSLNEDILTFEYSSTLITKNDIGKLNVKINPWTHKGHIVTYYKSEFPEKVITNCFLTSFPALQGSSGAPIIYKSTGFSVCGMLTENVEHELIPAQTIKIQDGKKYSEETKYFLPYGKALSLEHILEFLVSNKLDFEYLEV